LATAGNIDVEREHRWLRAGSFADPWGGDTGIQSRWRALRANRSLYRRRLDPFGEIPIETVSDSSQARDDLVKSSNFARHVNA
jgi:hypothetical protein